MAAPVPLNIHINNYTGCAETLPAIMGMIGRAHTEIVEKAPVVMNESPTWIVESRPDGTTGVMFFFKPAAGDGKKIDLEITRMADGGLHTFYEGERLTYETRAQIFADYFQGRR